LFDGAIVRVATRLMVAGEVPWRRVAAELARVFPGVEWDVANLERRFEALKGLEDGRGREDVAAGRLDRRLLEVGNTELPDLMKLGAALGVSPVRLVARLWDLWRLEPGTWSTWELRKLRATVESKELRESGGARGERWWQEVAAEVFAGRRSGEACRAEYQAMMMEGGMDKDRAVTARRFRPTESRDAWSAEENLRLHKFVNGYGAGWEARVVATNWPGRTEEEVVEHWRRKEQFAGVPLGHAEEAWIMDA
jgi:hypothetical protein